MSFPIMALESLRRIDRWVEFALKILKGCLYVEERILTPLKPP